jgi:hypothetical protein
VADWYVSSAAYAAVPAWAASTAYTVGQFVRPTAAVVASQFVFRCTTAGTTAASEPSWGSANNGTTVSGGATFTHVTGQSTYGWSAAAGSLIAIASSRTVVGDRVLISSDHSETSTSGAYNFNSGLLAFGSIQIISVNRAGSVPPVAADLQSGATINGPASAALSLNAYCGLFWHGITFGVSGASGSPHIFFNGGGNNKIQCLKNCALVLTTTVTGIRITSSSVAKVVLDNTTVQFGAVGQAFGPSNSGQLFDLEWINTPNAIQGATVPTNLFSAGSGFVGLTVTCRGVDLSAITTTLCTGPAGVGGPIKALFDSCKIASGVTRLALMPNVASPTADLVEIVNCYDGTNVVNERYGYNGSMVFDRATYLDSVDDAGGFSTKLTSSIRPDFQNFALGAFQFDVGNTLVGSSKTATIEVLSGYALNDTDFRMVLQYMGTVGSPIASFGENLASVLTAGSALPSSSAAWNNIPSFQAIAWNFEDKDDVTLSNSNLTATASAVGGVRANVIIYGKVYWECTGGTFVNNNSCIGLANSNAAVATMATSPTNAAWVYKTGAIWINNTNTSSTLGARVSGDIIGIAVDVPNNLIWFRVAPSGNWNGSGTANPATGIGGLSISGMTSVPLLPAAGFGIGSEVITGNFGASAFTGTVPSGFTSGFAALTPNKQKLQVTFTPQRAGRVRGLVRLGKPLATVWVNPQVTIS